MIRGLLKSVKWLMPTLVVLVVLAVLPQVISAKRYNARKAPKVIYSYDGPNVRIYSSEVTDTLRMFFIADTHLWLSDEREEPFRQYSKRMASAYHRTKHFQTGKETNPEAAFKATVELAKQRGADVIALAGDILSYPSERGVEFVNEVLGASGIPYYYTCGNHDWHYEGMEGHRLKLRDEWRGKRLMPLFRDNNPAIYGVEIKGVRLLFVDSSTYDILPEQLEFMQREVKDGKPFIMMQHIPMYAPSRPFGYGIGHPDWGAGTDNGYELERREKWPEEGHQPIDYEFYDLVTTAPNLLATFAGHVHTFGTDIINGRPHFTVGANFQAAYYEVLVMPMPEK